MKLNDQKIEKSIQNTYLKHSFFYNIVFVLSGLALSVTYLRGANTSGWYFTLWILLFAASYAYLAYGKNIVAFALGHSPKRCLKISVPVAILFAILRAVFFYRLFAAALSYYVNTPTSISAIYNRIPLAAGIKDLAISGLIVAGGMFSVFAIYIVINFIVACLCVLEEQTLEAGSLQKISSQRYNIKSVLQQKYVLILVIVTVCSGMLYLRASTEILGATVLTFSYSYGFISRGLLGTVLKLLTSIFGMTLSSSIINMFSWAGTIIFSLTLILFFKRVIGELSQKGWENTQLNIILFILVFTAGAGFSTYFNDFGRFDIYMIICTVVCCRLLISDTFIWLVIPLTVLCILIHQGYIFMFFNVVLALLLYKLCLTTNDRKRSAKLFAVLTASLILCSAMFLYFQFYSHTVAGLTYEQVYGFAKQVLGSEYVHTEIIQQELFGKKIHMDIMKEIRQLPLALITYSPFIYVLIKLWKRVREKAKDKRDMFTYTLLPLGFLTAMPLFIHMDYGRWFYAMFFYEFILILSLVAMKDTPVRQAVDETFGELRRRPIVSGLLVSYAIFLGPFYVTVINQITMLFV
jgi:hypothetical protein